MDVCCGEYRGAVLQAVLLVVDGVNSHHTKHSDLLVFDWHDDQRSAVLCLYITMITSSTTSQSCSSNLSDCTVWGPLLGLNPTGVVLFIVKATATYSLGYGLRTLTVVNSAFYLP